MNATLQKFGFPSTTVWQGRHWAVLLRPQQATLGSLVLCVRDETKSHVELSEVASTEHAQALRHVEMALRAFRPYDKLNFLTLMMVDPHLHTHVLPRYATAQTFDGLTFNDPGWPALPDLKHSTELPEATRVKLTEAMVMAFKTVGPNA